MPNSTSLSQRHPELRPRRERARLGVPVMHINKPAWTVFLLAVLFVVIEGALRKWVGIFGGGAPRYAAYFSKDIIFGLLLLLPARAVLTGAGAEFGRWLGVGCLVFLTGAGLSCLHGFNLVGSALTVRAAVALPVIAYLAIPRLRGVPVRQVAWLLAMLTIANFAVAVVQNRLPGDHFLNKYAAEMEQVVELETGVRATGTFSYISGLGILSSVGVWAGLVLLGSARRVWEQMAAYAALAAGFGCGLASVSRAPVVLAGAMVLGWLIVSHAGQRLVIRSVLAAVLVAAVAWGTGVVGTLSRLGEDLLTRHEQAGDTVQERSLGQMGETLESLFAAPLGRGLGTEQVGGNYASSGGMKFTTYEAQLPRIVMESGILGLVGFLIICGGALWALQQARRGASSDEEKAMLLATQLLLLPVFYMNVIFNHTASAFVWMIFAVAMAAIRPRSGTASARVRTRNGRQAHRPISSLTAPTPAP